MEQNDNLHSRDKYEDIFNAVLSVKDGPDEDFCSPIKMNPSKLLHGITEETDLEYKGSPIKLCQFKPSNKKGRKRKHEFKEGLNKARKKNKETTKDRILEWNYFYSNVKFGIWVQCTKCLKWRKATEYDEEHEVPTDWCCSMSTSGILNCDEPEDTEGAEFSPVKFIPGSIVWAKIDGYPWWPGMIEDDPDTEEYYWIHDRTWYYNVTFLDAKVTHAWVPALYVRSYLNPPYQKKHLNIKHNAKYSEMIEAAKTKAKSAINMSIKERFEKFSFAHCYKGKWPLAEEQSSQEDTEYLTEMLIKEVEDIESIKSLDSGTECISDNKSEFSEDPLDSKIYNKNIQEHTLQNKNKKVDKEIINISDNDSDLEINTDKRQTDFNAGRKESSSPLKEFMFISKTYNCQKNSKVFYSQKNKTKGAGFSKLDKYALIKKTKAAEFKNDKIQNKKIDETDLNKNNIQEEILNSSKILNKNSTEKELKSLLDNTEGDSINKLMKTDLSKTVEFPSCITKVNEPKTNKVKNSIKKSKEKLPNGKLLENTGLKNTSTKDSNSKNVFKKKKENQLVTKQIKSDVYVFPSMFSTSTKDGASDKSFKSPIKEDESGSGQTNGKCKSNEKIQTMHNVSKNESTTNSEISTTGNPHYESNSIINETGAELNTSKDAIPEGNGQETPFKSSNQKEINLETGVILTDDINTLTNEINHTNSDLNKSNDVKENYLLNEEKNEIDFDPKNTESEKHLSNENKSEISNTKIKKTNRKKSDKVTSTKKNKITNVSKEEEMKTDKKKNVLDILKTNLKSSKKKNNLVTSDCEINSDLDISISKKVRKENKQEKSSSKNNKVSKKGGNVKTEQENGAKRIEQKGKNISDAIPTIKKIAPIFKPLVKKGKMAKVTPKFKENKNQDTNLCNSTIYCQESNESCYTSKSIGKTNKSGNEFSETSKIQFQNAKSSQDIQINTLDTDKEHEMTTESENCFSLSPNLNGEQSETEDSDPFEAE